MTRARILLFLLFAMNRSRFIAEAVSPSRRPSDVLVAVTTSMKDKPSAANPTLGDTAIAETKKSTTTGMLVPSLTLTASPPTILVPVGFGVAAYLLNLAFSRWCIQVRKKNEDSVPEMNSITTEAAVEDSAVSASSLEAKRYETLESETVDQQAPLQALQEQIIALQAEVAKQQETAAYWKSVAHINVNQLQAAVQLERAHGMHQLECLKDAMVATVNHERAAMVAEFQAQIALLRSSLLQEAG